MTLPKYTELTWEPSERWIRGTKGDVTVVDSTRAILVRDPDRYTPLYAFPKDEVRMDLLRPAADPPAGPHAVYDLVVGDVVVPNAAWTYSRDELADHVAFEWFRRDDVMDHWYEEDEEVFTTARDPQHRVDAIRSTRHVKVTIDGQVVAESSRPVLVFETGIPVRYYLPPEDVRMDLFEPTETRTGCPYKGFASYWTYTGGDEALVDVAWGYLDPNPEAASIKGYVSFYDTVADHTVSLGRPA
jgi:uncharacterized protein (DUF427 family)